MDRGRGKPVEELRVLTVDAVLQICIFGWLQKLLSVYEVQWRVGGRKGRKEKAVEKEMDGGY